MQTLWCWRCKAEMPMLDEHEFSAISQVYKDCMMLTKELRQATGAPLHEMKLDERFQPVRALYEQITGMRGCHHNAVMHHRLALYGPPCESCGKPLRTPKAKLCGACMHPKSAL